jgi:hypothetical protein
MTERTPSTDLADLADLPPSPFGSRPYDQEALTLSLALRAILYRAGVVDSPELPRIARPPVAAGAPAPDAGATEKEEAA